MLSEIQPPNLYSTTAELYDTDNRELGDSDIGFYMDFAKAAKGAVLDLCCGTGRIAIPFANNKIDVTAVDFSQSMLAVLNRKIEYLDADVKARISVVHGDMRSLDLNQRFKLIIIALRSFQVLQNPVEVTAALNMVHKHLDPDGVLIIDIFKPLEDMKILEGLTEEKTITANNGGPLYRRLGTNSKVDTAEQLLYCHFEYYSENLEILSNVVQEDLQIKYYYEGEFNELLSVHNFLVKDCYGNYDYRPTNSPGSSELIFVCQLGR